MYQLSVRAAGRFTEVNQFEDIVVKSGRDGALVRVKDVGRVELGAEDYLPKPINAVLLRARLGACLEKKRLRDREHEGRPHRRRGREPDRHEDRNDETGGKEQAPEPSSEIVRRV